jgi:putative biotin synthesis protein, bioC
MSSSLAHQFDRAAPHYNKAAQPQRIVIDRLVRLLDGLLPKTKRHFTHAFEMGAGSGLLTERIDQLVEVDRWTLSDLSQGLLEQVPSLRDPNPELWIGDATDVDLKGLNIDLFVSANAIQWLVNPCSYIERVLTEIEEQAVLAVTTFGPNNLLELRQLTGQGLEYPSIREWRNSLERLGYPYKLQSELLPIHFTDPLAVLSHLRHTGTTQLPGARQQIHTLGQLESFTKKYIANFADNTEGVTLTFHPIYIIINKHNVVI